MVCGQIHASATLPNHIHMHLMNSNFLAILYCFGTLFVILCQANDAKACDETIYACCYVGWLAAWFLSLKLMSTHCNVEPRSLHQASLLQELYLWAASFVVEFSWCVSRSCPFPECKRYRC